MRTKLIKIHVPTAGEKEYKELNDTFMNSELKDKTIVGDFVIYIFLIA